jgi:dihydroneopterin aldolase
MSVLKSSWQIAAAAGEPHSMIRVQNLQAIVKVGRDAWGRTGKTQPILISATLSLREAFEQASIDDSVDNPSTVHYGTLSKAILEAVSGHHAVDTDQTLRSLLNHILRHVTGKGLDSAETATHEDSSQPILDSKALKSLELKLFLPKASLIGSGVSLAGNIVYANSGDAEAYSMSLKLHELRIPAIIGVNPNERPSKQIIVTNIELDTWSAESDLYNELEEVVVKVCSSYHTPN